MRGVRGRERRPGGARELATIGCHEGTEILTGREGDYRLIEWEDYGNHGMIDDWSVCQLHLNITK